MRGRVIPVVLMAGILCLVWLLRPMAPPFSGNYSTLVYDCHGLLIRATLNANQQYCFPPDTLPLPYKYVRALLLSEDRRFYHHPGVDIIALAGAFVTNLKARERLRGGSTLTMQVVRLSDPKPRTYWNKFRECLAAVRLSVHFSKKEILGIYAAHVPMGGNVTGIQAASYRYFGKPAAALSWAEAALFVVLPNSPSSINLERKRPELLSKRNDLINKLAERSVIDRTTARLACREPLPDSGRPLPFEAPHFCEYVLSREHGNPVCRTSLDLAIQKEVENITRFHANMLGERGIRNMAVLMAETRTGRIRAYLGSQDFFDSLSCGQVDGIRAFRSTGSLLKPFLVARALDRGPYTMASVIQDVPTYYGTFSPQNADKTFSGLATLEQTLIRSLNVPSVRLLNAYGLQDFYDFLKENNMSGLFRNAAGYGLSLILGGAETCLYDLTRFYLSLANPGEERRLHILSGAGEETQPAGSSGMFSEGAAWLVLNALKKLDRPGSEYYWHQFNNQVPVAWKTGTSYGQKDGWAIGMNRQWVIGVWAGNFSGEGNAALSGAACAAPLLFNLFNRFTQRDRLMWYSEPEHDLIYEKCCGQSGYPAGPHCPDPVLIPRPLAAHASGVCPYHKKYLIDRKTGKSVCSLCWKDADPVWETRFIVPAPVREILERSGRTADAIPLHASHCPLFRDKNRFEILYPVQGLAIWIPRNFDGTYENLVMTARHQHPDTRLFWFVNHHFIGETVEHHELAVSFDPGQYTLVVQDEEGFIQSVQFSVFKKET